MPLYSVIIEHAGGTYVSQLEARNEREALLRWRKNTRKGREIGSAFAPEPELPDDFPRLLKGLRNIWCSCGLFRKKLVLMNIVKTVSGPRAPRRRAR